jgi:hypothetical protein
VEIHLDGHASRARSLDATSDGAALGTATHTAPDPVVTIHGTADGTATYDRAAVNAWLQRSDTRMNGVRVEMELAESAAGTYTNLSRVQGVTQVDEELSNPVQEATFEYAHDRVAYNASPSSLSGSARPVRLYYRSGPPGSVEELLVFDGQAQAGENTGALRARTQFRCLGLAAQWSDKSVCLRAGAFSGLTRGAALRQAAESAGITIENADIDEMGAVITKPVDVQGVSIVALIAMWDLVEGWYPRVTAAGNLEVLSESAILSGPIRFAFDHTNCFDISEQPPMVDAQNPPFTKVTLATTVPTEETALKTGGYVYETLPTVTIIDDSGLPVEIRTDVQRWDGQEVFRRVSRWAVKAAPGVTNGPAIFQEVERQEITTRWVTYLDPDAVTHPSTQVRDIVTEDYKLWGVPCSDAFGGYDTWADDAGYFTTPDAAMLLWARTVEEKVYNSTIDGDPDDCGLKATLKTFYGYYSPLADPGATSHTYADGTERLNTSYQWGVITSERMTIADERRQLPGTAPHPAMVTRRTVVSRYVILRQLPAPDGEILVESTSARVNETIVETWVGNPENTRHVYTLLPISGGWRNGGPIGTSGEIQSVIEDREGPVPGPGTGKATVGAIAQTIKMVTLDISDRVDFPAKEYPAAQSLVPFAESEDELIEAAKRILRRGLENTLQIRSRDIPYLRVGDRVTVTDPTRALDEAEGYVFRLSRTRGVINGVARQITIVKIPPTFPGVEAA